MTREELRESVLDAWSDLGLIEGNALNSIKFITLIVNLEEKFSLEFEDEDLDIDRYGSVNGMVDILYRRYLGDKGAI